MEKSQEFVAPSQASKPASNARDKYMPMILKRNHVRSVQQLREKLLAKYPMLKNFRKRVATSTVPGGDTPENACRASRARAKNKCPPSGLRVFINTIDQEYNFFEKQTRVIAHGIDEFGNVARVEFKNFRPYFYAKFPEHWGTDVYDVNREWLDKIRGAMESAVHSLIPDTGYKRKKYANMARAAGLNSPTRLITDIRIEWHISAVGFTNDVPVPFLRIELLTPELVPYFRRVCENPLGCEARFATDAEDFVMASHKRPLKNWVADHCSELYKPSDSYTGREALDTWESDIDFTLRFQSDKQLSASSWWQIWGASEENKSTYNVDVRYVIDHNNVRSVKERESIYEKMPEDFIFLFDGEMTNKTGTGQFPDAANGDPVIQMGIQIIKTNAVYQRKTMKQAHEDGDLVAIVQSTKPIKSFISTASTEENRYPVHALNCETERVLIDSCYEIQIATNVSMFNAYNGDSFDTPYMIIRAKMLRAGMGEKISGKFDASYDPKINEYFCIGRDFNNWKGIRHRKARQITKKLGASQRADSDKVHIDGCVNIDMLKFVQIYKKFGAKGGFSLNNVSGRFLGERKLDIDHNQVYAMFQIDERRLHIAKYCNRDVELMTRLIINFDMLRFLRDMSRRAMICPQKLVDRGTEYMIRGVWHATPSVRDITLLYPTEEGKRNARGIINMFLKRTVDRCVTPQYVKPKLIMPAGAFYVRDMEGPRTLAGKKFAGAVVVEPVSGINERKSVFDFASLYPSIMRTLNICPTTLIPHYKREQVLRRTKRLAGYLNVPFEKAIWTRTDNWYVTGDKEKIETVEEALRIYTSGKDCPYDQETIDALKPDYDKLVDPDNQEYVQKWLPLAENRRPNTSDEEMRSLTPEQKRDIYIDVVEPACRLTGRTKCCVTREDMPQFVQSSIREGVFPQAERLLAAQRKKVKVRKAEAEAKVERLLLQGVSKTDKRIIELRSIAMQCDT